MVGRLAAFGIQSLNLLRVCTLWSQVVVLACRMPFDPRLVINVESRQFTRRREKGIKHSHVVTTLKCGSKRTDVTGHLPPPHLDRPGIAIPLPPPTHRPARERHYACRFMAQTAIT